MPVLESMAIGNYSIEATCRHYEFMQHQGRCFENFENCGFSLKDVKVVIQMLYYCS